MVENHKQGARKSLPRQAEFKKPERMVMSKVLQSFWTGRKTITLRCETCGKETEMVERSEIGVVPPPLFSYSDWLAVCYCRYLA